MMNTETIAVNDNRTEFETMRRRLVDAQAKRLAHQIEHARFKMAWQTLGQVVSQ